MKRWTGRLTLVLAGILVSMQCLFAHAALTEEEQLANKRKAAEAAQKEKKRETQTPRAAESETETETEPAAESEAETEAEPAAESGTETEAEPAAESEAETETEPAAESETKTETEPVTQEDTNAGTETGEQEGSGPLVAIDPGHQAPAAGLDMERTEPLGPGSAEERPRLTPGTEGTASGLAEYELDLQIALKLAEELKQRGYRVILTRETHDVDLGNAERCAIANEAGADILLHIHANDSEDSTLAGAQTAAPSQTNPFVADIYNSSMKLADDLINAYCETTGLNNRGVWVTDQQPAINWSEIPVTILEIGYMTNPEDDAFMSEKKNQDLIAQGIADGIDVYFGR